MDIQYEVAVKYRIIHGQFLFFFCSEVRIFFFFYIRSKYISFLNQCFEPNYNIDIILD